MRLPNLRALRASGFTLILVLVAMGSSGCRSQAQSPAAVTPPPPVLVMEAKVADVPIYYE
jgi:multidrug efflux pump subunit AcrA (membrane-fusion protein)